ncbi:MAG: hypothetical protein ACEPOV_12555 [Hyphomicrobiales bacterium]
MKKLILFICLLIITFACNNSLDKIYSDVTVREDLKRIETEISAEEYRILSCNIMRLGASGDDIYNMTYQEILDEGKDFEEMKRKL